MNVIIVRKKIKNMYLRVKEDGIYITCNKYVTEKEINNFINNNVESINKMVEKVNKNCIFMYLGNSYDVIYKSDEKIVFLDNKLFVQDKKYLDKWILNKTKEIFNERVDLCKSKFTDLPIFDLKIRNMKTRWGVCNHTKKIVTLNSKLIRFESDVIDYVIYHELCHFIHPNHSSRFWVEVSKYTPNYKKYRKILKND